MHLPSLRWSWNLYHLWRLLLKLGEFETVEKQCLGVRKLVVAKRTNDSFMMNLWRVEECVVTKWNPRSGRVRSSNMFLLVCSVTCLLNYLQIASLIIHLFSVNLLVLLCSLFRFFVISHHIYECSCFIYEVHSLLCCACYSEESLFNLKVWRSTSPTFRVVTVSHKKFCKRNPNRLRGDSNAQKSQVPQGSQKESLMRGALI